jgi:hypothetical protein
MNWKNLQKPERRKTKVDERESTRPYLLEWDNDGDRS